MAFRSVPYDSLSLNPFTKIGKEWALLTAGDENGFNTMTVSWGAMGFMWGKPSVTVYIRPQRYTKEFVDTRDTFTLSFYPAEKKDALSYLGKVSGRDEDKVTVSVSSPDWVTVCCTLLMDGVGFTAARKINVLPSLMPPSTPPE